MYSSEGCVLIASYICCDKLQEYCHLSAGAYSTVWDHFVSYPISFERNKIQCRMLKAFRVVKRYQLDKKTMAGITAFRCSSNESAKQPKAVIFDMGGVVLPAPFEMFKGIFML